MKGSFRILVVSVLINALLLVCIALVPRRSETRSTPHSGVPLVTNDVERHPRNNAKVREPHADEVWRDNGTSDYAELIEYLESKGIPETLVTDIIVATVDAKFSRVKDTLDLNVAPESGLSGKELDLAKLKHAIDFSALQQWRHKTLKRELGFSDADVPPIAADQTLESYAGQAMQVAGLPLDKAKQVTNLQSQYNAKIDILERLTLGVVTDADRIVADDYFTEYNSQLQSTLSSEEYENFVLTHWSYDMYDVRSAEEMLGVSMSSKEIHALTRAFLPEDYLRSAQTPRELRLVRNTSPPSELSDVERISEALGEKFADAYRIAEHPVLGRNSGLESHEKPSIEQIQALDDLRDAYKAELANLRKGYVQLQGDEMPEPVYDAVAREVSKETEAAIRALLGDKKYRLFMDDSNNWLF